MLNFSARLTEHCTRSKSAQPGNRELFFSRLKLNVSRLRRPGAVRAQPCFDKQDIFNSKTVWNVYFKLSRGSFSIHRGTFLSIEQLMAMC